MTVMRPSVAVVQAVSAVVRAIAPASCKEADVPVAQACATFELEKGDK